MKLTVKGRTPFMFAMIGLMFGTQAAAFEIITEQDIIEGIIVEDQLVRLVDNAIFLIDTSNSMNDDFQGRGQSKLELAVNEFKRRNAYLPELGYRVGLYQYTPWTEVLPVQVYDRDAVAAALDTLPTEGSGNTLLAAGIDSVTDIIENLSGRTALFLFYDGDYTGPDPNPAFGRLLTENDVCLVMVSSANTAENEQLRENVSRINNCSRLVPLEYYLDQPEYMAGALYDVRATAEIVTLTESRIVGLDVADIMFDFDKAELTAADRSELDELGEYMENMPDTYVVLAGYTDNVGPEVYNQYLSQQRTEMVARYLEETHGIGESRVILHSYGSSNPVASNATAAGRAQNRRVEVVVGGL